MKATSIYNRAGTVHEWDKTYTVNKVRYLRSICGLYEQPHNLDELIDGLPACKRCAKQPKAPK